MSPGRILMWQRDSRKEMTIDGLSQKGLSGLIRFTLLQNKNSHEPENVPTGTVKQLMDLKKLHGKNGANAAVTWTDG